MVRRCFGTEFYRGRSQHVPSCNAFRRLIERFEASGGNARQKVYSRCAPVSASDVMRIETSFQDNAEPHLREASRELNFSIGKIWFVLTKVLE